MPKRLYKTKKEEIKTQKTGTYFNTKNSNKKSYDEYTKEDLIAEIEQLKKRKKYGLVWEEQEEKFDKDTIGKLPVLKEIKNKEIKKDKDGPVNLLIEGDNYHALSVLNYTHDKAVDMICIDPPYNTGSKDFKYNDQWVDREDSYRHSKWLSFMEKRLKLAKNILKDTGSIFIFIDDNEIAQLRLLMDDIFGENNFKNCIIWAYRTGGAPRKTNVFAQKHDYILFYSRSDRLSFNNLKEKIIYKKDFFGAKKDKEGNFYVEVNLRDVVEGEIELLKNGKPYKNINVKPVLNLSSERVEKFPSQKPIGLIKFLLEVMTNENSVICDFFAGTGTTGEAVLELNKENKSNRQFILCTNNENGIASDICYPRIKRAVSGYKNRPALGGNLKYFKTAFVGATPSDANKKKLTDQSTEMLCIRENTFEKVLERKHFKIFKNNQKHTGILYDQVAISDFKKVAKNIKGPIHTYIFSLEDEDFSSEFEDMNGRIVVSPIPEVILRVYRRIFGIKI